LYVWRGAARDRQFVAFPEIVAIPEIARQREVHDRPEIAHGIFHRSTGQHEAMPRAEGERGLSVLRLRIFDVLRFVEHGGGKVDFAQCVDVAS